MRILIADGGTGGHIFPAIAVAQELEKRPEVENIIFTGTPLGLESEILPRYKYELKLIHVGGLIGKGIITRMRTLLQLPGAYWESRKILMEFRPDVVIGFGAYASGPVLVAAHFRKIPILLLEPNAVPGFTNRVSLRFAANVAVPYEDRIGTFQGKAVVTGTPVRALKSEPQKNEKLTIGIFGGSQGAHGMNVTIVEALPKLAQMRDQIHLIHQTGQRDFDWAHSQYELHAAFFEVIPFIHEVDQFYNRCDLLIYRAGAITLAEVTALGKPAILVPLPTSTHNHQEENAKRLEEAGAAQMIRQSEFTVDRLLAEIQGVLSNRSQLEAMAKASRTIGKPDAAKNVADLALKLANGSGGQAPVPVRQSGAPAAPDKKGQ